MEKQDEEFPTSKAAKSGFDYRCKECHRAKWKARNPPKLGLYSFPDDFTPTKDSLRMIFDLENGALTWKVNTPKTKIGDIVGESGRRQSPRAFINGKRYLVVDLKSIWKTGSIPEKKPKEPRNLVFEAEWMKEIRSHRVGFDWSILWNREAPLRQSKIQYARMTPDQKKSKEDRRCKKTKRKSASRWKARMRIESPSFRLRESLSSRLSGLLKSANKANPKSTMAIVGCSIPDLVEHLESKFKRGMTWDNYGTNWHVDHVLPVSSFDHDVPSQVKQCWHWTNLEPLGSFDNMSKGAKITRPQMALLL